MTEPERPLLAVDLRFGQPAPEKHSGETTPQTPGDPPRVGPSIPAIRPLPKASREPSASGAADVARLLDAAGLRPAQAFDVVVTTPSGVWTKLEVGESVTIGRSPSEAGLVIDDPTISRRHCRVLRIDEREVTVEDLASANGTWLHRGEAQLPLEAGRPMRVEQGDWIRSGPELALARISFVSLGDGSS